MAEPETPPWEKRPPCFKHGKYAHCEAVAATLFSDGTYYEFTPVNLSLWVRVAYNTRRGTQFNYLWRDIVDFRRLNGWPDWGEPPTDEFHENDNLNAYNWDWNDLKEWLANHPGGEKEAFQEWLEKHKKDQTPVHQTPQMDYPEKLQTVPYGDPGAGEIPINYPDGHEGQATEAMENLWEMEGEIDPAIWDMFEEITITTQPPVPEKEDEGNLEGKLTFYENGVIGKSNLLHEVGHNFAKERWGSSTPPPESDYRAAMNSGEAPITALASTNPANDFAESFVVYVLNEDRLRTECPRRWTVVDRMIEDPTYPG